MEYRIVQDYGKDELVLGTAYNDPAAQPPGDQVIYFRLRAIPTRWDMGLRLEPVAKPEQEPE